ncbi:WD40 domain-containing protein [Lyngbya aestuarii]|uniref:WD40 domain-containing protein n=1 Tax=Lyngbya aestuarii TaxID=118322 RepID=UPI00403DDE9C
MQEFINEQNLAQELAEIGVFREQQIRSLLGDLLPVLQFIHEGQVIHRDIKPDNIIRSGSDARLVLVDFGAAKYAAGKALGKTGTTIGSAGYAAPEQMFRQAVFASDIYSLGVTCIHLLTNIEPFTLYNAMASTFVWQHHLDNNPVSDQLERVLNKMTQSAVQQRHQSALEVIQDLEMLEATSSEVTASSPTIQILPKIDQRSIFLVTTLKGHSDQVFSIAFSPNGKILASGSGYKDKNNCLNFWDVDTGQEIRTIKEHSGGVNSIAFSPEGKILAHNQSDTIKLLDVGTGREIKHLKGHSKPGDVGSLPLIISLAFSPDGKLLASGSKDCTIKLWEVSTGREVSTLQGHRKYINSVAFSPDGKILASGSKDKYIKLWNVNTGSEITTLGEHLRGVSSVVFSPDGKTLVSGGQDNNIKLWDVDSGQEICTIKGHSSIPFISSVAVSPDGKTLASGGSENIVKLWNFLTRQEIFTLEGHSDVVYSVAFSPDGTLIASGSWDNTINIWRVIG